MKTVFISNKITPHQLPCCKAFQKRTDFTFIETMKEETSEAGWYANSANYSFVIPYTENSRKRKEIQKRIIDADIVIYGSAPDSYLIPRLKARKLSFRYSERLYKEGISISRIPRTVVGTWLHHGRFQCDSLYMLCASAFTAIDCARFGNYKNRMFKWGYFPETRQYELENLFSCKQESGIPHLLWAGRFLKWKHPDAVIGLAKTLKAHGYVFQLDIIGYGEMENVLRMMILDAGLSDCVSLLGKKTPEQVREYMEHADLFLFTSDFHEGWGAVLNEAMNSACAVVASHAIGATPYLITHGINGLVYLSGNENNLCQNVEFLLERPEEIRKLGAAAYKTINDEWNAEIAVERLLELSKALLAGEQYPIYSFGPCSKAPLIHNNWYPEIEE